MQLREPAARVIALMRERERLLVKITRKKQSLDKQVAWIEELQVHLARAQDGMRPLMEQGQKVEQEVHQLFAALLTKGRLKRKEQRLVRGLYDELQRGGVLPPEPDAVDEDVPDWHHDDPEPCSWGGPHPPPGSPDWFAAAKRPAAKGASSLRDIFRRLAVAIHPDRSQTDEDRDHRTEAMKEVTRAYQDGDLARLLELENAWLAEDKAPVAGHDETERRCANLERTNRELKRQFRELERESRELKHSVPVLAAEELGLRGKNSAARVEGLLAEMQSSLDRLHRLRDFVRSFVEGRITFDAFLRGPDVSVSHAAEEDDDLDLADLDALLLDFLLSAERGKENKRGRRPERP
jgi:hypothetical protein